MDRVAQETVQAPRPLGARGYYQRIQDSGNHEWVSISSGSGPTNLPVQDHPGFVNLARRGPPAASSGSGGHASNYQSEG